MLTRCGRSGLRRRNILCIPDVAIAESTQLTMEKDDTGKVTIAASTIVERTEFKRIYKE